jgi:hypothetical protein
MAEPLLLTVLEAAATLRCSRARIFQLLADGTLVRGNRYGRQTVILAESVFEAAEVAADPVKRVRRRKERRGEIDPVAFRAALRASRATPQDPQGGAASP